VFQVFQLGWINYFYCLEQCVDLAVARFPKRHKRLRHLPFPLTLILKHIWTYYRINTLSGKNNRVSSRERLMLKLRQLRCVALRWSGSGSVIQDHLDHGSSKEQMNPLCSWIHRFLCCTLTREIPDPDHPKGTHPKIHTNDYCYIARARIWQFGYRSENKL